MSAEYFEKLADRIFDPSSSDLTEAAEVIRYAGKLQRLYEATWAYRSRRLLTRVLFGWRAYLRPTPKTQNPALGGASKTLIENI